MRYVLVPEPVVAHTVSADGVEKPSTTVSMHDFLCRIVLTSPKLGKGGDCLRRARKIEHAFRDAPPGTLVGVEDADYAPVREIVNDAEWQSPMHALLLLPLVQAIESAERQDDEWKRQQKSSSAI